MVERKRDDERSVEDERWMKGGSHVGGCSPWLVESSRQHMYSTDIITT